MSTSDPRRWAELRQEFEAIADLPAADQAARVVELRRQDRSLAEDLDRLLRADDRRSSDDLVTSHLGAAVRSLVDELGVEHQGSAPRWIGDYRIEGTLGSGGMGVVYRAEQQSPRRTVALKVIRGVGGESAVRRFQREAELLGRLQHPNIALIHEAGLARERDAQEREHGPLRPYFAMEFVHGTPIVDYVVSRALSVPARVELFTRVCDAIDHAHARGVLHRDLKPANILVDEQGQPKVLDFGIARALDRDHATTIQTAVGEVIGTLPYMSPEQVGGKPSEVGVRSDVYALGVVLFEMLTGRRPIDLAGRSLPEAVRLITDDEPTRLASLDRTLRGDLETIVARCLEKEPARRYPGAGALAADLRRHLLHQPIEARPASTLYQLGKFARRHRPLVAGIATAFAALLAATAISITMAYRADAARLEAEKAGDAVKEQLRYSRTEHQRSVQSFAFLRDLLTAADPARSRGKEMTVRELVIKAADTLEANSTDAQVTGQLGQLIGFTLFRLGDLPNAERALRRAVTLLRQPDAAAVNPEAILIEALTSFGDVLREAGKLDEAALILNESIERRQRVLQAGGSGDAADVPLAVALNNLSLVHRERGDLPAAEEVGVRALAMERALVKAGANRQTQMAITLVNLAGTRMQRGRPGEADEPLREAVAIAERTIGPDAPLTQTFRNNLAANCGALGRHDEAVAMLKPVVEQRIRTQPEGHFERSRAISNLGVQLLHGGRALESLTWTLRAVDESRKGKAEPLELGITLMAAAHALVAVGDLEAASELLREADELLATVLPMDNPRRIDITVVTARIERLQGRAARARELALEAAARVAASENPNVVAGEIARREAATALIAQGSAEHLALAVRELDALIATLVERRGGQHSSVGLALLSKAEALRAAGDPASAAPHAQRAAEVLDQPGRLVAWLAEYARLLADASADPAVMQSAPWPQRVEKVEASIIEVAGDRSPELRRLEALRPS